MILRFTEMSFYCNRNTMLHVYSKLLKNIKLLTFRFHPLPGHMNSSNMKSILTSILILALSASLIFCSKKSDDGKRLDTIEKKAQILGMAKEFSVTEFIDTGYYQYSYEFNNKYIGRTLLFQDIEISDIYEEKEKFYLSATYFAHFPYFLKIEITKEQIDKLIKCHSLEALVFKAHNIKKVDIELLADFKTEYYQSGEDDNGDAQYSEQSYPVIKAETSESFIIKGQLIHYQCKLD